MDKPRLPDLDTFETFNKALRGEKGIEHSPDYTYTILSLRDYESHVFNIVNKVLKSFLKTNTDEDLFQTNNHIAIKRLGNTFQVIHLFPELNLPLPSHFIHKDSRGYYIFKTRQLLEETTMNYLARHQASLNVEEQYFATLPIKVLFLEVEEVLFKSDKKAFVAGWIKTFTKCPLVYLQRALEEEILKAYKVSPKPFNPSELIDYVPGAVDKIWVDRVHQDIITPDSKLISQTNESKILKDSLLKSHQDNQAIQRKELKPPEIKSEVLVSQEEVDRLLKK